MSREIKRRIAKEFKAKGEKKHPSLKNINVSTFMKKVEASNVNSVVPINEVNIYAILMNSLQMSAVILSKTNSFPEFKKLLELFLSSFKPLKETSYLLAYAESLLLTEDRIGTILSSIDDNFNIEEFMLTEDQAATDIKIKSSMAPFLLTTISEYITGADLFSYYSDFLLENEINIEEIFKQLELSNIEIGIKGKSLKQENILNRLLNINHNYTNFSIKSISKEMEKEVEDILNATIHNNKIEMVIRDASNHFARILEARVTFTAMYGIVLTRADLKILFRTCYYYTIYRFNDMVPIPKELEELVEELISVKIMDAARINLDTIDIEEDEHFSLLLLVSRIGIPSLGFIFDSAANIVIQKTEKKDLNMEVFKIKMWKAIGDLVLFLNSNNCNKLYRSTYAVDIKNNSKILNRIVDGDYEDNQEWLHKLLKNHNVFKTNKKYIAI